VTTQGKVQKTISQGDIQGRHDMVSASPQGHIHVNIIRHITRHFLHSEGEKTTIFLSKKLNDKREGCELSTRKISS